MSCIADVTKDKYFPGNIRMALQQTINGAGRPTAKSKSKWIGEGLVCIPPLKDGYVLSQPVVIKDRRDITIFGGGQLVLGKTQITTTGGNQIFRFEDCENIVIEDLVFNGNRADLEGALASGNWDTRTARQKYSAITLQDCDGVAVRRCRSVGIPVKVSCSKPSIG